MTPRSNLQASAARHYVASNADLRALAGDGPLVITSGSGIRIEDEHGKQYIEAMAGLWCCGLGFSEPRLTAAAAQQMDTLPYYHNFAGRTADRPVKLAERLAAIAPAPLQRTMFQSSGSEANDAAIKLVWFYQNARGKPDKKKILSRHGAYHGVTIMSGSLTGLPGTHAGFDLPRPGVIHLTRPHYQQGKLPNESEAQFATRLATELEATIVAEGADTIAAMIAEPVMGAGGVIVPPAGYFDLIPPILRRHDILLIIDEVICGFGRLGTMFGCERFGIVPDLMTVAKQITSGYVPLSAVMMSNAVFDVVADESQRRGIYGHGYTYAGHLVAYAVALQVLDIYAERDLVGHVGEVAPAFQQRLAALGDHHLVGETRGMGLIGAIQLFADRDERRPFPPEAKRGAAVARRAMELGLIVRALGQDTIALCPPLIITRNDIDQIFDLLGQPLDSA